MENLFNFDYEVRAIRNRDDKKSVSRFSIVYGEGGKVVHCKKNSYEIIPTQAVSDIASAFIGADMPVNTFVHRNGEKIGIRMWYGKKKTKVGDMDYQAVITIPNNGEGRGYLSIIETRLVCTNGMVRKNTKKLSYIKIPHSLDYEKALELMQEAVLEFDLIVKEAIEKDERLNEETLTREEILFQLNKWFFYHEMPKSHKKDMTFNQFRELLATDPIQIKSIDRYYELKKALDRESSYNEQLNLQYSRYTVFATIANYISRRVEKSQSKAPAEIVIERASKKIEAFI